MKDTRITQAEALVTDAQNIIDELTAELAPSDDRRELLVANDNLTRARNRLIVLAQCRHRAPSGIVCGLPAGHYSVHQRSYNGGRSQWNDTGEQVSA